MALAEFQSDSGTPIDRSQSSHVAAPSGGSGNR
jgi:hypothetical protein